MTTRNESGMSSYLLCMGNRMKKNNHKQMAGETWNKIKHKAWSSSAVFHFISCSILADQCTFNSQGSESIPACTYIEQHCENIFFRWQEAINQCERWVCMHSVRRKDCLGQGHRKPWMSRTVTWHFEYLMKEIFFFFFKILLEMNKNYSFLLYCEMNENPIVFFHC